MIQIVQDANQKLEPVIQHAAAYRAAVDNYIAAVSKGPEHIKGNKDDIKELSYNVVLEWARLDTELRFTNPFIQAVQQIARSLPKESREQLGTLSGKYQEVLQMLRGKTKESNNAFNKACRTGKLNLPEHELAYLNPTTMRIDMDAEFRHALELSAAHKKGKDYTARLEETTKRILQTAATSYGYDGPLLEPRSDDHGPSMFG